jgi:hypothetical protein
MGTTSRTSALDRLIAGIAPWIRGRPGPSPAEAPPTAAPAEEVARPVRELVERLQAEALPHYAALDVGLWGPALERAAAEAVQRVLDVAVWGDELG